MSGKSKEEIAFELVAKLKGVGVWGENNRAEILDMYAECLEATSGLRSVGGKTPAAMKLAGQTAAPTAAPVARPAAQIQQPAAAPQPQIRQPQPAAAQPAYQQPVAQPR